MTVAHTESVHGTVRLPQEDVAWRTMRIRGTRESIQAAWNDAGIPGIASFTEAPGDRGIDLSVELPKKDNDDAEHRLSPFDGESLDERLETALWTLKAKVETGEVATTEGQPSGRRDD